MSSTEIVPLVAVAAVASTFLGGLFAIHHRDRLHLILGFSAGAVMGVVFFDLIPEAIALSSDWAPVLMASGFIIYMLIDRSFSLHSHKDEHCDNVRHTGRIGASALIIHSLMDGIGMGLAFNVSPSVGFVVAAAVLAHDFSDGVNTSAMIMRSGGNKRAALAWLSLDALAPAIGMMAAMSFSLTEESLGMLIALFAGFFMYIGASDLIPTSHARYPHIWTSLMTVVGMGLILFAVRMVGG
jgi:ZIP family zinc transporter